MQFPYAMRIETLTTMSRRAAVSGTRISHLKLRQKNRPSFRYQNIGLVGATRKSTFITARKTPGLWYFETFDEESLLHGILPHDTTGGRKPQHRYKIADSMTRFRVLHALHRSSSRSTIAKRRKRTRRIWHGRNRWSSILRGRWMSCCCLLLTA